MLEIIETNPHAPTQPKISVILLDWSVREAFTTLYWLRNQTLPREQYELIWVEMYDRVIDEVADQVDKIILCHQDGLYHKHKALNAGLLAARGEIFTSLDSDAVVTPNFMMSILASFYPEGEEVARPKVLMHHEWRTPIVNPMPDPPQLTDLLLLQQYQWLELWPNVGACMSVRVEDAIRYGGFDESERYRGYLCGLYDLSWRLVNAGIPEEWYDPGIALWHFAHEGASANASDHTFQEFGSRKHVDHHAYEAVKAFSTGRITPMEENPDILARRLAQRCIGTEYEEKYGTMSFDDDGEEVDFVSLQIHPLEAKTIAAVVDKYATPGMTVCELGTYTGRSTLAILPHVQRVGGHMYCVDWFRGTDTVHGEITASYEKKDILQQFLQNVTVSGYRDLVTTCVGTSEDAARVFGDESLDMIFIDADHRYSAVRRDILQWYGKLKPGGIMFGHDFECHLSDCDYARAVECCEEDFVDGLHYGVIRAVSELFPHVEWENRIWFIQKNAQNVPCVSSPVDEGCCRA